MYAARLSTLKPKTQQKIADGDLRLPALDDVKPDPSGRGTGVFSKAAQFYLDAWNFVSLWRPSGGGFSMARANLSDLEIFMAEAGLPASERSMCRNLVGRMDAAFVAEVSHQSSGKK